MIKGMGMKSETQFKKWVQELLFYPFNESILTCFHLPNFEAYSF